MTIAWLDATAGIAGDMLLGALVDAGADLDAVQAAVDAVISESVRLSVADVERQGQRASKLSVEVLVDDPPHRRWATIRESLRDARLADRTRTLALDCFGRLAEAEARVHGISPDEVHFHEVGALDSIADVVGCCEALRLLGIDDVVATAVAVGEGRVRVAHGLMPVPVPAVAQLALGWPTVSGALPPPAPGAHSHDHPHAHATPREPRSVGELATPTGMALVRTFASGWGAQPAMVTDAIGIGAGTKDTPGRPNVVRILIGSPALVGSAVVAEPGATQDPFSHPTSPAIPPDHTPGSVAEIEANIDDLDPRLWPGVLDRLLQEGAVDAWLVPILMKRGRPAHTLHVLCPPERAEALTEVMFATTTTLGVRRHASLDRRTLGRTWVPVEALGHPVRIKVAHRDGTIVQATAEFSDVAEAARALRREQVDVLRAAEVAAASAGLVPGTRWPGDHAEAP